MEKHREKQEKLTGEVALKIVDEKEPHEEILRLDQDGERPIPVIPPDKETVSHLEAPEAAPLRRTVQPEDEDLSEVLVTDKSLDPESAWEAGELPKASPYGWFVLILIVLAAIVGASVWRSRSGHKVAIEAQERTLAKIEKEKREEREAGELVDSIEHVLRAYATATSVDQRAAYVRDAARVRPLMDDWYSRHEFDTPGFSRMGGIAAFLFHGVEFWGAHYELGKGGSHRIYLAKDGQEFKVDWETDVNYQPMNWDDFARDLPEDRPLDFRVFCRPDDPGLYSHEFADETKWNVFMLTAPGSVEFVFGYVARGSALEKTLTNFYYAAKGRPMIPVLRLRRPLGTMAPKGVLIEALVSETWLLAETPIRDTPKTTKPQKSQ